MYEENNSRKVFLSVLGVAILLVAVVGISFAAYTYETTGGDNSINTGTITMSYTEPENGINLVNALPVADSTAMGWQDDVFSFTVATNATGTVNIPYEISIQKTDGTLLDNQVKVYLTKGTVGGTEQAVYGPKLMSELMVTGNKSTLRTGTQDNPVNAYKIYTETVSFTNGNATNATANYNLRIWVDAAATVSQNQNYKVLVHVDSAVKPIGRQ